MAICENAPSAPGYTIINPDKTVYAERSTDGVTEIMTGVYGVEIDDADMCGRYVVFDADGLVAVDDAGILAAVAERTDRLPDAPAAVGDVTTATAEIIAAIPSAEAPAEWPVITPETLDTDGNALGRVPPGARLLARLAGTALYETTADSDGDYALPLPPGSTWTLSATAAGYETTTAEVAT